MTQEIDTITLTTARAESSYGRPVLVVDGEAYGPADLVDGRQAVDLVRQWAARFGGEDVLDTLPADLRRLAETNPATFQDVMTVCRSLIAALRR